MTDQTKTQGADAPAMRDPKTFVLSRSKVTVLYDADPSVAQVIAAQRASQKQPGMFVLYLAQATATFNGARWTMGEIRERIRGKDYLSLAAEMLNDGDDDTVEGETSAPGSLGK